MDLHFTSGNWGFKSGSWDTRYVFCGPSLDPTAKPHNLGQLSVSDSPCSQVGQAWDSPGARRAEQQNLSTMRILPLLTFTLSATCLIPSYLGGRGEEGGADSFQYSSEVICYYFKKMTLCE